MLDLTHALAYKGVFIIPGMTGNESLQAKVAGRWITSLSFLVAPLFLRRRINLPLTLTLYGAVLVLTLAAIFRWHAFPACYVPEQELTAFEQLGRLVSGVVFLAAAVLLARRRTLLDAGVFPFLFAALMVNAASELFSATLIDLHGTLKVLAHLAQVVSLFLVCQALLTVRLRKLCNLAYVDLKSSQEALHKEPIFIAAILETTGAAVAVMDAEGRLVRFTPGRENVIGYCGKELVGRYLWDCLPPPEDREALKTQFHDFCRGVSPSRTENVVVAKDGNRRLVQWSATVLRDAHGAVDFVVCTGHDITEQRLAEERRARSLRRLEGVNRLQEKLILPASLEEKFKSITDAAVELIELDFCRIWMVKPGELCNSGCIHAADSVEGPPCRHDKCLHLIASSGRYTHTDGGHRRVPLAPSRSAASPPIPRRSSSPTASPPIRTWPITPGPPASDWCRSPATGCTMHAATRPACWPPSPSTPLPRRATPSSPTWRKSPPR